MRRSIEKDDREKDDSKTGRQIVVLHTMKTFLKILLTIIVVVVATLVGLILWLTITEYKPSAVEPLAVVSRGEAAKTGKELTLLSWNIGYSGLGAAEDFFMDGGKNNRPKNKETVYTYLEGIRKTLKESDADIIFLQEVDQDSTRSYNVNQRELLSGDYSSSSYALNFSCPFVPIPFPPMGKVNSGLLTLTDDLAISSAQRLALTCPFSWPVRIANLKRCLLVSYVPVEGSDKQLVLVNLHLEAYTEGAGREAQAKQLLDFISSEYKKGNYVIAGGDFNQFFPGSREVYPKTSSDWNTEEIDSSMLPDAGWSLAYDLSVPTCRSLDKPYDPSDPNTQYYSIDGLILSPNVKMLEVKTMDTGFRNSDHNPVELKFILN